MRGNIENPASYFQNTQASALALDLLMLTQGWRRYNIAELAQGNFSRPTMSIENISKISGIVKNDFSGTPAKDMEVTIMSLRNNYFDKTKTDKDGRFSFRGVEWPDSASFTVSVKMKKTSTVKNLIIDKENFPERTLHALPPTEIDTSLFAQYAEKADRQYVMENGMRMIHLPVIHVTAQQKPLKKSQYYDHPDYSVSLDEMQKNPGPTILSYLKNIPGLVIRQGDIYFMKNLSPDGTGNSPALIVDNIFWDIKDIGQLNGSDVAQIDILTSSAATIYGSRAFNGAIVVYTKSFEDYKDMDDNNNKNKSYIKDISPLGYQQPAEFYAPKYETNVQRNNPKPDLRTTIHWQPVVQTDSQGRASFEFYTADEKTSYTVIMEGLADDGTIIRLSTSIQID